MEGQPVGEVANLTVLTCLEGGVADDSPDAVVVDGARSSWEELVRRADALAAELDGATAVAVSATSTLDTVVAVVAGLRAGVPVVPIPADAGESERRHILTDSGADLVIGAEEWPGCDLPRLAVPGLFVASPSSTPARKAGDAPALIMYTSGTTGSPKGVMLSSSAIAAGLDGLADAWGWTPNDTLVHGLPLFHVHGLILGVLGALRVGSRLIHTGRPTPERYAAAQGTLYFGVPTVWSRVAAQPHCAVALSSARLLVSGSAVLPVPVFERLRELCGQAPVERYGMTETLITVSTRHDGPRRPGCVGTAIDGVATRLRDDDGTVIAHDGVAIGVLEVSGATLFNGYLGRPDATAASLTEDQWFRTGDAATIDADGFHRIVGRSSIDIIKTGGYKVGAGEVEDALLSHPAVSEAAAIGIPDDDLGERIVAYVVSGDVTSDELIGHVAARLSVHKRPRAVHQVDALPRNAMGKVQKHLLRP